MIRDTTTRGLTTMAKISPKKKDTEDGTIVIVNLVVAAVIVANIVETIVIPAIRIIFSRLLEILRLDCHGLTLRMIAAISVALVAARASVVANIAVVKIIVATAATTSLHPIVAIHAIAVTRETGIRRDEGRIVEIAGQERRNTAIAVQKQGCMNVNTTVIHAMGMKRKKASITETVAQDKRNTVVAIIGRKLGQDRVKGAVQNQGQNHMIGVAREQDRYRTEDVVQKQG